MSSNLSTEDIERLLETRADDVRAEIAGKVAGNFQAGRLSESERVIAEDIFRHLVKDVAERVRKALADNLKDAPDVPPEVARSLAADVSDEVAVPMIQDCRALDESDLLEIVAGGKTSRQMAVASREHVSGSVAEALVETAAAEVVARLVDNPGAALTEQTLDRATERHGDDSRVQNALVGRPQLPVRIAEKLVARVSEDLKTYLVTHHPLSEATATDLMLQARERATMQLVTERRDQVDLPQLIEQLHVNGRLTPSMLLRALCVGDMAFFEAAMAQLARIPVSNAHVLIHDQGELGFASLYRHAGLPDGLYPAFRTACELSRTSEMERTDADPDTRTRHILERVLTMHENIVDEFGFDNVDYLLGKLNKLAS